MQTALFQGNNLTPYSLLIGMDLHQKAFQYFPKENKDIEAWYKNGYKAIALSIAELALEKPTMAFDTQFMHQGNVVHVDENTEIQSQFHLTLIGVSLLVNKLEEKFKAAFLKQKIGFKTAKELLECF